MSSPEAFDGIHDYLLAAWAGRTPMVFENEPSPIGDTPEAWVLVEIFGDFFDLASIGAEPVLANRWREGGQVLMHVLTPNETGSRAGRVYAKQLVDLFRGQEIAGIRFRDASIGAGERGTQDGNYYRMTATIDWELDQ
ncbi:MULTISPECIES: hypothetical protein [unclassified Mesorhizobium]|uniref:hypothetical protein n=1 Tax=unclassified Mesorhizobium TaxID=325217 RepID=UPI0011282C41|nr:MULTISPECIES: hypothetical protein [unclassified Mesorhizobium]TPJ60825.1 hypothetical protein FJ443_19995 [Mesorhizobium sp. B2-6-1]TPN34796.1 hypothetical protein FJ979_21665 [Mesorhizobium sp. B1-1-6]